jgi:hypothetical protein
MFADKKISSIFAPELKPLERSNSSASRGDVFVSDKIRTSIGCCNPSESRFTALLTCPKQRVFNSLFLFKTFLIRQMERSKSNASSANNSTTASRVTHETRPTITPVKADITGTRHNKYVFSLRKAVREFLDEDAKGYMNALYRFNSKIEAARLLFPEDRIKFRDSLLTINTAKS